MSNYTEELNQIKTQITSNSNSDKSFAYSTLHHLQQQSTSDEDSLIPYLIQLNDTILSSIVADIQLHDSDEEIVTLALKCLGFMVYYPSLVAAIPKESVAELLESLARLIMTTKVKVVCNLGVWCLSIQQLESSYLVSHFESLLTAVVHSLDNPAGSLSTTFEGMQAVMKFATQISEKMRDSSSIWAPPIYRRLLSADKREREMCLRCLLKVKTLIVPPSLELSKAIAQDLKLRLIPRMKEQLKQGKKVQTLQAWAWFIRILGSYSLKSRHLINEMLNIPEQTLSDPDPQVQVASQVAWEGLIDALIHLPAKSALLVPRHHIEEDKFKSTDGLDANAGTVQTGGYTKSLKLIMTPLIGVMTNKADLPVQSSCMNTWCYLLHKLDVLVNDIDISSKVVEPMFNAVFKLGLEDRNIWTWTFCMDIFQDFIQSKSTSISMGSLEHADNSSVRATTDSRCPVSGEISLNMYSVKWLPWDHIQIDFLMRMIRTAFNQAALATLSPANSRRVYDTLLRMFHFFLKGVQLDISKSSTTYTSIAESINAILMFSKMVCETAVLKDEVTYNFQVTCLRVLEAIYQELDSSILCSPFYKISLDLKGISHLLSEAEENCKMLIGTSPMSFPDKVLPIVYLTVLYFSMVIHISSEAESIGCHLEDACKFLKNILSLRESEEVLHAVVAVLYALVSDTGLLVWLKIAQGLRDYVNDARDLCPLKVQPASTGCATVRYFLIYPLVVCSSQKPLKTIRPDKSLAASAVSFEYFTFQQAIEMWVPLYCVFNSIHQEEVPRLNNFAEDLSLCLNGLLCRKTSTSDGVNYTSQDNHLLCVLSDVVKCILENLFIEKVTPEAIKCGYKRSSSIKNCFELIGRLTKLLWTRCEGEAPPNVAISRVLPYITQLVSRLQWQEDIISLFKVLRDPLLNWVMVVETRPEIISHQVETLWRAILRSMQRSWPAIAFDCSFLNLQAPLLEITLDHPSPSISEPTIAFWDSAYGDQQGLDFPPCLLKILDKLSRLGKIKINKKKAQISAADVSPPKYKVMGTLSRCSKRVRLSEKMIDGTLENNNVSPCPKRKCTELTERQKEVRRAQQGRVRDSSGHGPGIRTYTSVDFSQGNEDSQDQDSQDIRDPELILDLLRRAS